MKTVLFVTGFLFLLIWATPIRADIPPDPGYKRVRMNIILEIKEAMPDYRFFLVSGNLAREIFIKPGEKTTVESPGGGSRYRAGTLVAIPANNLKQFDENQSKELEEAVSGGNVGAIKLADHSFVRDVRESEARDLRDASYRIERDASGVTAVPLKVEEKKQTKDGPAFGITDIEQNLQMPLLLKIVAGIFFSLAVITFGLWRFVRLPKKQAQ